MVIHTQNGKETHGCLKLTTMHLLGEKGEKCIYSFGCSEVNIDAHI